MSIINSHRLDFERIALLRQRLEELATELHFSIGDFDIYEDTRDTNGHEPVVKVELIQNSTEMRIKGRDGTDWVKRL